MKGSDTGSVGSRAGISTSTGKNNEKHWYRYRSGRRDGWFEEGAREPARVFFSFFVNMTPTVNVPAFDGHGESFANVA